MTNAWRHASPSMVGITIEMTGAGLAVRLEHDGRVTDPDTWLPGKGLCNMRARIAELGGAIEWRRVPAPATGLAVAWQVPLVMPTAPGRESV